MDDEDEVDVVEEDEEEDDVDVQHDQQKERIIPMTDDVRVGHMVESGWVAPVDPAPNINIIETGDNVGSGSQVNRDNENSLSNKIDKLQKSSKERIEKIIENEAYTSNNPSMGTYQHNQQ